MLATWPSQFDCITNMIQCICQKIHLIVWPKTVQIFYDYLVCVRICLLVFNTRDNSVFVFERVCAGANLDSGQCSKSKQKKFSKQLFPPWFVVLWTVAVITCCLECLFLSDVTVFLDFHKIMFCINSRGTRIRTWTNGSRDRCATVTPCLYDKNQENLRATDWRNLGSFLRGLQLPHMVLPPVALRYSTSR